MCVCAYSAVTGLAHLPTKRHDEQPSEGDTATVGSSLDHLIGTWTDAEADEIKTPLWRISRLFDEAMSK